MREVASGVWQFRFAWPNAFNAYFIDTPEGGIVVDASTRWDWLLMKWQLRNRRVAGMLLTHAHPDHQGCAARICRQFDAPFLVHEADAESAEGKAPLVRQSVIWECIGNVVWAGKRGPVSRRLQEGDEVAGFKVFHMPGHTRGQITLFRESDGVAIIGDVLNTNDYLAGMFPIVREPPWTFSMDPAENRQSIRKLWSLKPRVVCPGHGPVLRDMRRLERFVSRMRN